MRKLIISGKKGLGQFTLVDDEYFEWLNQWKWHLDPHGYVVRRPYVKGTGRKMQKCEMIRMHRLINNTPDGFETDHINRNPLDNRKCNLRTVTSSQNKINQKIKSSNTSGYKGITWEKQTQKWKAQIQINGKNYNLGRYSNILEAYYKRVEAEGILHAI